MFEVYVNSELPSVLLEVVLIMQLNSPQFIEPNRCLVKLFGDRT